MSTIEKVSNAGRILLEPFDFFQRISRRENTNEMTDDIDSNELGACADVTLSAPLAPSVLRSVYPWSVATFLK